MIEDYKKPCGNWAKARKIGGATKQTISGAKWLGMFRRCKDSKYHETHPTYIGATVSFTDFQEFTEWHMQQIGYADKYHLDKDLLVKGNLDYNRETCILLPAELNGLINTHKGARGDLPIGVRRTANGEKFLSSIGIAGRVNTHLGVTNTAEEAFKLYKTAKESFIQMQANKWKGYIDSKAYKALMDYKVCLND